MLVYSTDQLAAAAQFVIENNKRISGFTSIVDTIKTTIRQLAKGNITTLLKERELKINSNDWSSFSGTMGFYVLMSLEDENDDQIVLNIDILVDPSLGKSEKTYISEEFDSSLLLT